jgi:maleate cis-trans isomerase
MPHPPKVLLVVPANNTTMQPEIGTLCPEVGEILVARVKRPPRTLTIEDLPAYGAATQEAIAPFIAARPELIVFGCTAAGFLAGPEGNARIVGEIGRSTGASVISTAESMVEALLNSRVRSTAIVTPYLPPINLGLTRYLAACGVEVETLASFQCATTAALGAITQAQVMEKALATVTAKSQALFIACSQLPTLDIIEPLRERLGIPVWSSVQATCWAIGRRLSAEGHSKSLPTDTTSAAAQSQASGAAN